MNKTEPTVPLEETQKYGSLQFDTKKTGLTVGKCVILVDGVESIAWIQQEAARTFSTETRICRNLLNEMIRQKIAQAEKI